MNHNSRYDVSKRKRRDVPEELLHGVASFWEACPTAVFYLFPMLLSKNRSLGEVTASPSLFTVFLWVLRRTDPECRNQDHFRLRSPIRCLL